MSTLPDTPTYNANIPIITSAGGTSSAYKDPNSPESIMKKTTEIHAQTKVDSKYDVNQSAYSDGFRNYKYRNRSYILLSFVVLIFISLVVHRKFKSRAKIFLLCAAVIILLLVIKEYRRG